MNRRLVFRKLKLILYFEKSAMCWKNRKFWDYESKEFVSKVKMVFLIKMSKYVNFECKVKNFKINRLKVEIAC